MNPTSNLFLAILAMDAYNRIGGNVTTRNLVVPGQSVGDVSLSTTRGDNDSGFFAQSYVDATRQKIIAFGTDVAGGSDLSGGLAVSRWMKWHPLEPTGQCLERVK
jgi:hypothetical protein